MLLEYLTCLKTRELSRLLVDEIEVFVNLTFFFEEAKLTNLNWHQR